MSSDDSPYPLAMDSYPDNPGGRKVWVEMYPGGDAMIEVGGMNADELYVSSGEAEELHELLGDLIDKSEDDD